MPTTAQNWEQVASDALAQAEKLTQQVSIANEQKITLENRIAELRAQKFINIGDQATVDSINSEISSTNQQLNSLKSSIQQLTEQFNNYNQTASNAIQQAQKELAAPEGTTAVTAPVETESFSVASTGTTIQTRELPSLVRTDSSSSVTQPPTTSPTQIEDYFDGIPVQPRSVAQQAAGSPSESTSERVSYSVAPSAGQEANSSDTMRISIQPSVASEVNETGITEPVRYSVAPSAGQEANSTAESVLRYQRPPSVGEEINATRINQNVTLDTEPVTQQYYIKQSTQANTDWRFRISLANSANYFYRIAEEAELLFPLNATDGVIFPYTPSIQVSYAANYEGVDITHSNYKFHNYKNSSIENISITGEFTAQDSTQAKYVLAVMHFFRCATKMFYGNDSNPKAGIPPPLCYLNGFGTYAFNNHPVVITNFTLNYPADVNYISTETAGLQTELPQYNKPVTGAKQSRIERLFKSGLKPGGMSSGAVWNNSFGTNTTADRKSATWIPTKVQISVTAIPMISRNDISNRFSLKNYASGSLLKGKQLNAGGMW